MTASPNDTSTGAARSTAPLKARDADRDDSTQGASEKTSHKRRHHANLYDAVAGLVTSSQGTSLSHRRDDPNWSLNTSRRVSSRNAILAPHEALFRMADGPELYAEYDLYNSHERLLPRTGDGVLPSSELLKGLHAYSSRFYDALGTQPTGRPKKEHFVGQRNINERSMDETALLAFGILLEEAGREVLGQRGDLVFTEGREVTTKGSGREKNSSETGPVEDEAVTEETTDTNDGKYKTKSKASLVSGQASRARPSVEQADNTVGMAEAQAWPSRKKSVKRRRLTTAL
ncbi:hypothetical protein BROUX41_001556 [Berkeleyomyces rouxiae]